MKGLLSRLATISAAILLAATTCAAGTDPPSEWEVKAAYLYNFTRYVEWPQGAAPPGDTPFVVGVFGPDPFGRVLDDAFAGKSVGRRPLLVRRLERTDDVAGVQILFVAGASEKDFTRILHSAQGRPVLTVGDGDGLLQRGVILNFRIRDNRVRFEVNLATAEEARLRISSQLLKLALAVEGK